MSGAGRGHVEHRLAAYLSGGFSTAEAGEIEAHLASCDRCRRARDELAVLRETLAADTPPALLRSVWPYVDDRSRVAVAAPLRFRVALGAMAAAGILLGVLLGSARAPSSAASSYPLWSAVGSSLVGDASMSSRILDTFSEDGGSR